MNDEPYLTPPEVAEILNVDLRTLQTWRYRRRGPASHRLGHRTVRYLRSEVEAWLANR